MASNTVVPHAVKPEQLHHTPGRHLDRAASAGFDTLLVTVDTPVGGSQLRDVRNGVTIPPSLTAKTILNAIPRPASWIDFLTTEPLSFATLDHWPGTVAILLDTMFDPTVTFDDLSWIKEQWPGKLVVKGVQSVADAGKLTSLGVDGIVLSNHGGRQLDRAPVPFHLLPAVVSEVGADIEVLLDTGIMNGADTSPLSRSAPASPSSVAPTFAG